jgi:Uncharacterized conserved protein
MHTVYVARCAGYDIDEVRAAAAEGIRALGGLETLLAGRRAIAVKPNLLKCNAPDECVTTHPAVVQSLLEAVLDSGREAAVVESPSGPLTDKGMRALYDITGMAQAAKAAGARLNGDLCFSTVHIENGRAVKSLPVLNAILGSDAVISAAKLKTHSMVTYTGAAKNLFGVVPGLSKAECHFRFPQKEDFAQMLVDIADFIHPPLSVIDAVWAMEGDGPSAGTPRHLGLMIFSDNPFAADAVAGRIIGLDWRDNPVLKCAAERGLWSGENIRLPGGPIGTLSVPGFTKPRIHEANVLIGRVPGPLVKPLSRLFRLRPAFDALSCVGCGVCAQSCPADAITIKEKKARLHIQKCIRCFCCHEVCPEKAVRIKKSLPMKLMTSLGPGRKSKAPEKP